MPLQQALIDNVVAIKSLNPDDVVAYLSDNLHWTASLMNNTPIAVETLGLLDISVSAANVTISNDPSVFPIFGNYTIYPLATKGKTDGLNNTASATAI